MESELAILFNLAKVRQRTVEVHVYVTNFKSTIVKVLTSLAHAENSTLR